VELRVDLKNTEARIKLYSSSFREIHQIIILPCNYCTRKAGEAAGLKINVGKTKSTMVRGKENIEQQIELEDIKIQNAEFIYLGSLLTYDNDCSKEIGRRIGMATGVLSEFKNIWISKNISIKT